jgi:hypothetical protein
MLEIGVGDSFGGGDPERMLGEPDANCYTV